MSFRASFVFFPNRIEPSVCRVVHRISSRSPPKPLLSGAGYRSLFRVVFCKTGVCKHAALQSTARKHREGAVGVIVVLVQRLSQSLRNGSRSLKVPPAHNGPQLLVDQPLLFFPFLRLTLKASMSWAVAFRPGLSRVCAA